MRISCSATHIIAHITAWYAHIIAHITAWYACAYHTENTEHWPITQNSNRANIASQVFLKFDHKSKNLNFSCRGGGGGWMPLLFKLKNSLSPDHLANTKFKGPHLCPVNNDIWRQIPHPGNYSFLHFWMFQTIFYISFKNFITNTLGKGESSPQLHPPHYSKSLSVRSIPFHLHLSVVLLDCWFTKISPRAGA